MPPPTSSLAPTPRASGQLDADVGTFGHRPRLRGSLSSAPPRAPLRGCSCLARRRAWPRPRQASPRRLGAREHVVEPGQSYRLPGDLEEHVLQLGEVRKVARDAIATDARRTRLSPRRPPAPSPRRPHRRSESGMQHSEDPSALQARSSPVLVAFCRARSSFRGSFNRFGAFLSSFGRFMGLSPWSNCTKRWNRSSNSSGAASHRSRSNGIARTSSSRPHVSGMKRATRSYWQRLECEGTSRSRTSPGVLKRKRWHQS